MKTKLLKIVRKRYSITHYPKGTFFYGEFDKDPVTILADSYDDWKYITSYINKEKARTHLYDILIKWVLKDYSYAGKRRKKGNINRSKIKEKLWWK